MGKLKKLAPSSSLRLLSFRSFSRVALMLLMMLLTATTAGAADVTTTDLSSRA